MNNKLIAIAAAHDFDLAEFKAYATKYQYRYGKIVGGFIKPNNKIHQVERLINAFKDFVNPNRYLSAEDVDGLSMSINGAVWRSEVETMEAGCIVWSSKKSKDYVYATPAWSEDNEVPINVVLEGDEYGGYDAVTIKFPEGMPLKKQKKLYLSIVKSVIETL
jgi:hypothetical protein